MNASSVLANLLRLRMNEARMASELHDADQPVRLLPVLEPEELPPEFEEILQIQVLGYRERLTLAARPPPARARPGVDAGAEALS